LAALAVVVVAGLTPLDAVAYTSDDYANLQDKINATRAKIRKVRAKERAILGEINASDQRLASLESSLASITDQLLLATRRLQILELQHEQAAVELQIKTSELELATIALDNTTTRLRDRAMNIYINGPTAYAAVLFGANDFHGYVAGMQYAENVLHVDVDIVEEIRGLKTTVEAQRLALETKRKALEVQANEVSAQYARLAGLRSQQAGAKSAVEAEIDYKEHLLARVRREKRAYADALAERGGVLGAMLIPFAVGDPATLDRVVDHVDHAASIMGDGGVALGGDFTVQLERATGGGRPDPLLPPGELARGIEGLAGPEDYPALVDALRRRGWEGERLDGLLQGNLRRVLRRALPTA
jgi:peptidoglycan hydrolase CwlO-like protein